MNICKYNEQANIYISNINTWKLEGPQVKKLTIIFSKKYDISY